MYWLLFCLTGSQKEKEEEAEKTHIAVRECVWVFCECVCVVDREGSWVFASIK